nr:hypothetical protein [Sphingomonas folli]
MRERSTQTPPACREDLPLERRARAEGDHRDLVVVASGEDAGDIIRALSEDHRIGRHCGEGRLSTAVLLSYDRNLGEALPERQCQFVPQRRRQTGCGGSQAYAFIRRAGGGGLGRGDVFHGALPWQTDRTDGHGTVRAELSLYGMSPTKGQPSTP